MNLSSNKFDTLNLVSRTSSLSNMKVQYHKLSKCSMVLWEWYESFQKEFKSETCELRIMQRVFIKYAWKRQ